MNLGHFNISIKNDKPSNVAVRDAVFRAYSDNATRSNEYIESTKEKWNSQPINIKHLININKVLAVSATDNLVYFLVSDDINPNKDHFILSIYFSYKNKAIEMCINEVIKDIKKIIFSDKNNKDAIKIDVLKESPVYFYPSNKQKTDIYNPEFSIKYRFEKSKLSHKDKIKFGILFFISVVLIVLYFTSENNSNFKSIYVNFFCSIIFFIVIEFVALC